MTRSAIVLLGSFACAFGACSSIPTVEFVPEGADASTVGDAAPGKDAAGSDGASGATDGAPAEGAVVDAPAFTCGNPPPGVTCCAGQFCQGDCPDKGQAAANCQKECEACSGGALVCCHKSGKAPTCVPVGQTCVF